MKVLFICFLCQLAFCVSIQVQSASLVTPGPEEIRKNSLYLEVLGNGAVNSFNYDQLIPIKKTLALVLRVGGNKCHGSKTDKKSYNFLGSIGLIRGALRHFVEPGLG